ARLPRGAWAATYLYLRAGGYRICRVCQEIYVAKKAHAKAQRRNAVKMRLSRKDESGVVVGWVERSEAHRVANSIRWASLRSTHPTTPTVAPFARAISFPHSSWCGAGLIADRARVRCWAPAPRDAGSGDRLRPARKAK